MNFDPAEIAEIYCRGRRDLHVGNGRIERSLWAEDAFAKLKRVFGGASDRFSLASAESYLGYLGYDRQSIKGFTFVVEKTVEMYMIALADDMGHWPEFTFDRCYFLGFHADGKPLTDEIVLEEFQSDVRRKLVLHKMGSSPFYTAPHLIPKVDL